MNKSKAIEIIDRVNMILNDEFDGEFEIKISRRKFGEAHIDFKIEMIEEEMADQFNDDIWVRGCAKNGVMDHIKQGMKFKHRGHVFTIDHVKDRKQKYPVICKNSSDGKLYKFAADFININAR